MASIAQLVSEVANSLGQPNNIVLRNNIRSIILHTRNELIRRSYENHNYVDRELVQRYVVTVQSCNDGDINIENLETEQDAPINQILRTTQIVPRPVRLTNNLPFDRVSSVGYKSNREFPFIKETSARFRKAVPGLCGMPCYDYINGYIYIFPVDDKYLGLEKIAIEAAFEYPTIIEEENGVIHDPDGGYTKDSEIFYENEWLLPEDMIGNIKDIIYKRDLLSQIRETNETPDTIKHD